MSVVLGRGGDKLRAVDCEGIQVVCSNTMTSDSSEDELEYTEKDLIFKYKHGCLLYVTLNNVKTKRSNNNNNLMRCLW